MLVNDWKSEYNALEWETKKARKEEYDQSKVLRGFIGQH